MALTGDVDIIKHANELLGKKQFHQAIKIYISVLRKQPQNTDALNMLGAALIAIKKNQLAINFLEKALQESPENPYILNNLGLAYFTAKKLNEAKRIFERINKIKPDFKLATNTLLQIYQSKKEYSKALALIEQQQELFPKESALTLIKACLYTDLKQYQNAYNLFKLISDNNNFLIVWYYGICAYFLNKNEQAIQLLDRATQLNNQNHEVWNNLGTALTKKKHRVFLRELHCFRKAFKIKPDFYDAYNNYALTLIIANKAAVAKKILEDLTEKKPDNIQMKMNLALAYRITGHLDKAKYIYKSIIKAYPDYHQAKANLALNYLTTGNLIKGWSNYEYRWSLPGLENFNNDFKQPLWNGESLDGKTLLIACEQGFGDTIQFARYIPLIKKGSGKIIVTCQNPIYSLISTVQNIDNVSDMDRKNIKSDFYIPLLSLPKIFETTLDSIPKNIPYFSINKHKQTKWQQYFEPYQNNFKIGINWAGNPMHKLNAYRSIKPAYFKKIKINSSIKLFSLQKENNKEACEKYGFIPLGNKFTDFADSAACLTGLDLIISVDTAIAHLAGSLNLPIWTILGFYHDWRWLQDTVDSPWYPSMTLFRQPKLHDWDNVFDMLIIALKKLMGEQAKHE